MSAHKIAVFVSGRGSNLEALIQKQALYNYQIALVLVSKKEAHAVNVAIENDIPYHVLDRKSFFENTSVLEVLEAQNVTYICLAGFLWKIPSYLIQAFPENILNIHPSLLPKFGGKGMYGMKVHEAVVAQNEAESGITIHLVNEEYDKGRILFQTKISLLKNETASSLAARILRLEHEYFPKVLHDLCNPEK